jgi:hypothetical protein
MDIKGEQMSYRLIIRYEDETTSRGVESVVADGLTLEQASFVALALTTHIDDELDYMEEHDMADDNRLQDGNEEHE